MDFQAELAKWTDLRIDLADEYGKARIDYETLNGLFRVKLSERIKTYRKGMGFDTAITHLLEEQGEGTKQEYKEMLISLAQYKSIRYKIEAVESKIMSIQSLMKHYRNHDGGY